MKSIFNWLHHDGSWKTMLAVVYAIICISDFIIMPLIWNYNRQLALGMANSIAHDKTLDPTVALEMLKAVYRVHVPYTLQGMGSTFHIAFGALLTGSALSKYREKL